LSSEFLTAFQFFDRKDFMHMLDPRTKMILVVIYLTILLLFNEILYQLFIMVSLIPLIVLGHLAKRIIKMLKRMVFLFFFIIFFNTLLLSPPNKGFNLGIHMALRLINILMTFSLLFQTTSPDDISQAITKFGVPYHISFSLSLAFRFVPTLAQEMETITDAQKSRGLEIHKGGVLQQIRNLFPLLIPLISNSIKRAYYIAESLEARSFGINMKNRTYFFSVKMKKKDVFLILWLLILLSFGIFLKLNPELLPNWIYFTLPF